MTTVQHIPEKTQSPDQAVRPKAKEFWALDWLRFTLALYLVLFHTLRDDYAAVKDTWIAAVLGLGNMATTVFFILSGFLLTHAYVITKNGRAINRKQFFVARFSTVYPLHLIGLALAFLPTVQTLLTRGGLRVAVEPDGPAVRMLSNMELIGATVMNIVLLNAWNPYYLILNIPSWSLSALVFYYMLFPAMAPKVYQVKSPIAALVLMGVLFVLPGAIADLMGRQDLLTAGLLHHNPLLRLPLFLAGMYLCVLFSRTQSGAVMKHAQPLAVVILVTLAIGIYLQFDESRLHIIKNGLYLPASLAIVWLSACASPDVSDKVRYWGKRLGAISLPMFFLHSPLQEMFLKAERFLTSLHRGGDLVSAIASARAVEPSLALYPVYLIPMLFLCLVAQERFVVPFQAWIRTNFLPSGTTRAAAVPERLMEARPVAPDA